MTDDFLRDEDDKDFDPADLKKKVVLDLLDEEDPIDDDLKIPEDLEDDEDSLALYEADDVDSENSYSY